MFLDFFIFNFRIIIVIIPVSTLFESFMKFLCLNCPFLLRNIIVIETRMKIIGISSSLSSGTSNPLKEVKLTYRLAEAKSYTIPMFLRANKRGHKKRLNHIIISGLIVILLNNFWDVYSCYIIYTHIAELRQKGKWIYLDLVGVVLWIPRSEFLGFFEFINAYVMTPNLNRS